MNAPVWRIWLVGVLILGWLALTLRFVQQAQWAMAALCAILALANAVTLWRMLKHGR